MQLLFDPMQVVPHVAAEDVPKVRQLKSTLDAAADRRECLHFCRLHDTDEPARDQRGLALLPDPPTLLWPPPLILCGE